MKELLLLIIIALNITGCYNQPAKVEREPLAIPSDTVLFKYILGDSKKTIDAHTKELLNSKIIKPLSSTKQTMRLGSESISFTESGYPCVIYVGEDSIPALMNLVFYNDTLLRQRFYTYNKRLSHLELSKLYGNSKIDNYPLEGDKSKTTLWMIGDKAIYTSDYLGYNVLYFEKMSLKLRMTTEEKEKEEESKKKQKRIIKINLKKRDGKNLYISILLKNPHLLGIFYLYTPAANMHTRRKGKR